MRDQDHLSASQMPAAGEPITLVLGASPNPARASHAAVRSLLAKDKKFIAVGNREGEIMGHPITRELPENQAIDTVTLYLNPHRQEGYMDDLLELKPRRIIFNPGTENPEFARRAAKEGIEVDYACTLVMLATGSY